MIRTITISIRVKTDAYSYNRRTGAGELSISFEAINHIAEVRRFAVLAADVELPKKQAPPTESEAPVILKYAD